MLHHTHEIVNKLIKQSHNSQLSIQEELTRQAVKGQLSELSSKLRSLLKLCDCLMNQFLLPQYTHIKFLHSFGTGREARSQCITYCTTPHSLHVEHRKEVHRAVGASGQVTRS